MRSLWCTLIAVCFVAGGVRPHHVERPRAASTLRHATAASIASARRTASSSSELAPVIAPAPVGDLASHERVSDIALRAPVSPEVRLAPSPRSSRGPPHA